MNYVHLNLTVYSRYSVCNKDLGTGRHHCSRHPLDTTCPECIQYIKDNIAIHLTLPWGGYPGECSKLTRGYGTDDIKKVTCPKCKSFVPEKTKLKKKQVWAIEEKRYSNWEVIEVFHLEEDALRKKENIKNNNRRKVRIIKYTQENSQ